MSKLFFAGGLIVFASIGNAQSLGPRSNNWWERELWSRLAYSGSRTLGYQNYRFEGDQDAFSSLTNYGTGLQRFTDIGNFSLQGNKVFGLFDFQATFADNRFSDPEQQRYTLNYKRGFWDVSYGTVQASLLGGNRFANFSRSLKGFVGDYKKGKIEVKAISSTTRGAARTVTIEGNNTVGPYYLSSGRIIGGSVKVLVDGVESRQGVDYLVEASIGSITFIGRSIAPTSTIIASYESFEISGNGGTIQGAALSYDLGRAGTIGLTAQQQKTGNATTTNDRIESFQGFGTPGDRYALQFEPIPASIIVTVDGIVRSFSVIDNGFSEFYLSPSIANVVISRVAVPSTQTLQIRYIPKLIVTVDGDRQVTGFDWRLPLGKKGSNSFLTYSRATGRLSGSNSSKGDAQSFDVKLVQGKGQFKMGVRRVDPGFRSIEQTGFNRNEDATDFGFDYATKGLTATTGTSNSLISTNNGGTPTSSRVSTVDLGLRYSDPRNGAKEISRFQTLTWNQTKVRATDDTRLSTLGFKDNFHHNKLTFGYGIENQTGRGRVNGTLTGLGVNSYRTSATYDAGKNWALTATAAQSMVKTDTIHSQGYDYSIRANMTQRGPWSGGFDYSLSDSGELASLGGFLNGNSLGYGNNGFGGSGGTGTLSTGQLKARRAAFYATHQAGDSLTMGITYSNTSSNGSTTSNAKIDALTLTTGWRINPTHTLNLDYSKVKSDFFFGSAGASNSDVISAAFNGTPGKFWSYGFSYNLLRSTGSQLGQDSLGLNVDLGYRLNVKQRLFFNASLGRTRGLFPQDDSTLQTGYSYFITPGVALTGKYNFRNLKNLDPQAIGGAFRANGLSIELNFDFSNRR